MSEGGNNTIKNVLTLDVGQFDTALQSASKKLENFDKSLDKTANQAAQLESSLSHLNANVGNVNGQFGELSKSLATILAGMNSNAKATAVTSRETKKLSDETKRLSNETKKTAEATDKLGDFTKKYNDNLKDLNKTTKKGTEQQNKLKDAVDDFSKTKSAASKKAIKASEKELSTSLKNNQKALKDHRKSLNEITQMKRDAEQKLSQAQAEFDRRYFGKNRNSTSAKANELRSGIEAARQELQAVNATRERVAGIVSGLEAKNVSLRNSLDLSMRQNQALEAQIALQARLKIAQDELNKSAREQLRIQRQQANQKPFVGPLAPTPQQLKAQAYYANPKNFVGPYTAVHPNNVLPYGQQQKLRAAQAQAYQNSANFIGPLPATAAQIKAQKFYQNPKNFIGPYPSNHPNSVLSYGNQQALLAQQNKQQAQNHQQQMSNLQQQQKLQMQMHQQQLSFAKELMALYAGMKLTQGVNSSVGLNSEYEQAMMRAKLWNMSKPEEDAFFQKSRDLAKSEKYLSNADATQIRIDAMSAVGYNNEEIIDKTIRSAARNVHVMRAAGFESGTQSDLMKNMYGFAEARQVMYDPEEVIKSFDVLRRLSVVSGGKIKVADIETVARNLGDLRQSISAEGWLSVGALAEQFKTAGGGNGGGGGVATVGTMLKMMALYGSGRTITNRAAEQLLGADVLNVFDGDAADAYKKNSAANKQFQKMIKNTGFKDIESMSEDPVRFFAGLRGQLLDYMMGNFETFFGHDRKKHTYNDKGQMVLDGQVVDAKEQDKIEQAALKRFLATLGVSNKAVDGLALMMNKSFIERAEHVRDSALKSDSEAEALAKVQNTFKGAVENLEGEAKKLAEAFMPLLPYLTAAVEGFTGLISVLGQFVSDNPAAGALIAVTVAGGGLLLTLTALVGKINLLRGAFVLLSTLGATGAAGTAAAAGGAAKAASAYSTLGAVATAAMTTVSTKSATTAGTVAKNSQTISQRIAGVGTSFANMLATAQPSVKGTIGLLASLLKWAGWVALAGMAGWVIGKWISDFQVGGLKIGEHMQNIFLSISTGWQNLLNNLRIAWNTWTNSIGEHNEKLLKDLNRTKREIAERDAMLRNKPAYERENDSIKASAAKYWNKVRNAKIGDTVDLGNGKKIKVDANVKETARKLGVISQAATDSSDYVNKDRRIKGSLLPSKKDMGNSTDAKHLYNAFVADKNAAIKGEDAPIQLENTPIDQSKLGPTPSSKINYDDVPKVGALSDSSTKPKKEREEREWNNLFAASFQDIKSRTEKQIYLYEELGKAPDYEDMAKEEFKRQWAKGAFDDDNDPRSRKFAIGAYDKNKGWDAETQIDWNAHDKQTGITVKQWLEAEAMRMRTDDKVKGLRYAAERVGSTSENVDNAFADYALGGDALSTASEALRRQFTRMEVKTPAVKEENAWNVYKRGALTNQSTADYMAYAKDTIKINEQLQIDLMDKEADRRKAAAELAFNEEAKKVDALRGQIDAQIAEHIRLGETDTKAYKDAVKAKEEAEKDFTARLELENEKRIRANEDAVQQMMRQWRDLGSSFESLTVDWFEDIGSGITDILTGALDISDIDWKSFAAGMMDDAVGAFVKASMGNMYQNAMGSANIVDVAKSLWDGTAIAGGGGLTDWLNKIRGLEAPVSAIEDLSGDAALNTNTVSLNTLTAAIQGLIGAITGNTAGNAANGATSAIGAGLEGAAQLTPGAAEALGGEGGPLEAFGESVNSVSTGGEELNSTFGMIKGKFGQLGESMSGLWEGVTAATGSLWRLATEAIGSAIAAISQWAASLVASSTASNTNSIISTIFSAGSMAAGAFTGGAGPDVSTFTGVAAETGYTSAGAMPGLQFAKGGAFTNGIYDAPTPFMFANGGSFGNLGVMGEAGPEAVMPLTRDSSGRLGVSADGLGGGSAVQNNVTISINVSQEGGSSTQTSGDGSEWKQMANSVRALVVDELAKQSRPGGINYKK